MAKRNTSVLAPEHEEPEEQPQSGDQHMVDSQKARDQRAFAGGNRKQRRQIAKRNKFFKPKYKGAFRAASDMVRKDDGDTRT